MVSLVYVLTITHAGPLVVHWAGQVHNKYKTYDLLSTNCSLVLRKLGAFRNQESVLRVQRSGVTP